MSNSGLGGGGALVFFKRAKTGTGREIGVGTKKRHRTKTKEKSVRLLWKKKGTGGGLVPPLGWQGLYLSTRS